MKNNELDYKKEGKEIKYLGDTTIFTELSYEKAHHILEWEITSHKFQWFATRPQWEGGVFLKDGDEYILLKSGEILKNSEIWGSDKTDWMICTMSDEAETLIERAGLLIK